MQFDELNDAPHHQTRNRKQYPNTFVHELTPLVQVASGMQPPKVPTGSQSEFRWKVGLPKVFMEAASSAVGSLQFHDKAGLNVLVRFNRASAEPLIPIIKARHTALRMVKRIFLRNEPVNNNSWQSGILFIPNSHDLVILGRRLTVHFPPIDVRFRPTAGL
jgi:hypothetical protein